MSCKMYQTIQGFLISGVVIGIIIGVLIHDPPVP